MAGPEIIEKISRGCRGCGKFPIGVEAIEMARITSICSVLRTPSVVTGRIVQMFKNITAQRGRFFAEN